MENSITIRKQNIDEIVNWHGSKTWKGIISIHQKAIEHENGDIEIFLPSYKKCLIEKSYWIEMAFKMKLPTFPEILIKRY